MYLSTALRWTSVAEGLDAIDDVDIPRIAYL